jgi:methyltransferase (TIGR00027 family)
MDGVNPESPESPGTASLPSVSMTAVGVAAIRAAESNRSDRLFDDPCAAGFMEAAAYRRPGASAHPTEDEVRRRRGLITWVAVRTRFLDDVVTAACAGACRQVVIVGAGLDARAFRLSFPTGTRLWELDLPEVLAFKEMVVQAEGWVPRCARVTVEVDLAGDWGQRLEAAGFDAGEPVVWLAEGLLSYLSAEVRDSLISRMAKLSTAGSRLGVTLAAPKRLEDWRARHPDGAANPGDYVALWQSTAPDEPTEWLGQLGWQAHVFGVAERASAYGRPLASVEEGGHGAHLVEATRR